MLQRKRSSDIPMNYNYCIYMDNLQSIHQQLESRYTYKRSSPLEQGNSYWVYAGLHKQLNIQVTIKVVASYASELPKYLKKLKDCKVQNVIKVIEIFEGPNALFLATEPVTYSTLKKAISKYKKLDDLEAIFISKVILSTHVDMLRAGLNWFGTEDDIQFTDNGLKLSWNNSIPFESQNPFPLILSKLAGRIEIPQQNMLPFPKSKLLDELINVSSLNASEISLNNNMKKKQKQLKRKGKRWLALKQLKNDFEYYEQQVYFAIHKEQGFVRIKVYKAGQLDEQVLNLNKTKNTFTKVIQNYNEGGKTYLVSEYSNDGSLYNYVNRLRANSIHLKQEQIEFFFFSLFEPLKLIQYTTIKSLCMLHIKNIYIENGIPKIGQPVPMNGDLTYQLKEKADVPDFYHSDFKRNPSVKTNTFDTYSLGVLMYKLMFTEYPIFPQKKVHIPTTPPYSARLKTTLQLFLNEGGLLTDLEKKIQVSQQVTRQVKLNKNKLKLQKQNSKKGQVFVQNYDDQMVEKEQEKRPDQVTQVNQEDVEELENDDCCKLCCAQLQDPVKHRSVMLDSLQQSPYAFYRITIKVIIMLLVLTFLYYFFFLQSANVVFANYSNLKRMNVTISTVNYEITVSDSTTFYKSFNTTSRNLQSLINLGCFINNHDSNTDYSSIAISSNYKIYAAFSIIMMIVIFIFKIIQIAKFDIIKTLYNMSNLHANFNMTNYILQNLFLASLINSHFILYHQIFQTTLPICFGVDINSRYGSDEIFYSNSGNFSLVFITVHIGLFAAVLLHLMMIVRTQSIRYTRLWNPILLLLPFLVAYIIIARLGAIESYFYPSLLKDINIYGNYFTSFDIVSLLGTAPEIFFLLQLLIEWIVDWIFWFTFDKKRSMIIHDISTAHILME